VATSFQVSLKTLLGQACKFWLMQIGAHSPMPNHLIQAIEVLFNTFVMHTLHNYNSIAQESIVVVHC
jgi:hypothetical protein